MSENTTPEQPESPALRSLADFLDGRSVEVSNGVLSWGAKPLRARPSVELTEAETSTVLALFALVALEWVARDQPPERVDQDWHVHAWREQMLNQGRGPIRLVCLECGAVQA